MTIPFNPQHLRRFLEARKVLISDSAAWRKDTVTVWRSVDKVTGASPRMLTPLTPIYPRPHRVTGYSQWLGAAMPADGKWSDAGMVVNSKALLEAVAKLKSGAFKVVEGMLHVIDSLTGTSTVLVVTHVGPPTNGLLWQAITPVARNQALPISELLDAVPHTSTDPTRRNLSHVLLDTANGNVMASDGAGLVAYKWRGQWGALVPQRVVAALALLKTQLPALEAELFNVTGNTMHGVATSTEVWFEVDVPNVPFPRWQAVVPPRSDGTLLFHFDVKALRLAVAKARKTVPKAIASALTFSSVGAWLELHPNGEPTVITRVPLPLLGFTLPDEAARDLWLHPTAASVTLCMDPRVLLRGLEALPDGTQGCGYAKDAYSPLVLEVPVHKRSPVVILMSMRI